MERRSDQQQRPQLEQRWLRPTAADRRGEDKGGDRIYCDNCGAKMEEQGCKLICPRCRFFYSCSDHLYPPGNA